MSLERRLLRILSLFAAIVTLGGVGFVLIEGWPWVDAFYMAIITVTTVGFGEIYPLSSVGKLFTAVLVVLGVASITYALTALTNYLIAGELGDVFKERKMKRQVESLEGHCVVCGFGRMGRPVCRALARRGQPFVVVDADDAAVQEAEAEGYLIVKGDAGDDQVLLRAGIERAGALVAALGTDADNLFVVLSSRALNRALTIVARANAANAEDKFLRAGADRIVSPYALGGRRIAEMLIRPEVVDFLDVVMHNEEIELLLENLRVGPGSFLDGRTVGEARVRETTGANILGVKRGGNMLVAPEPATKLVGGDMLVALGTRQQLEELAHSVRSSESL